MFIVEGLEELRAEIEELALEAMMELGSDDESSDDMEATANLVEEFIRACKGARCLAAATGFEGFLPDTLGKLPGELKAKLRKCLYGDGVTRLANEQTEAPWQRKMMLHHDDMLRIKHECVFLRRLAKARRACTARCRAEALAKGTPEKRVANIDDPAMLRVMSDLGLEELRAEIEELALEAMMELGSDDESSDDMEAAANLVEEFIRACKGARCLAAATGFEGFLPDTLGKLPGELKAKLRKCLYGDGVTRLANEQTEAPWQRKMVLHHDDMLRIKHECVFLRRLAKARRACTARCRAEALAKGTPEKRVANIDDPAMLRVMSDLVAFREACVPGTHYWLRNTMMGPRGLTDEEFAVVTRYRIGASEADHVVPDGVSINCASPRR
ncbi:hypothetical protein FNF31_07819 [Cafeteria roenbergensis]|uniref:Uncharacterized protein n=1 Tax=Cafeteria roenbergensis TaxID=33653 RepID=A0A5A8BZZ1_CAFRO|nr:hypothetical protein FNF31_07819 [Cafeteria roenbergensis]